MPRRLSQRFVSELLADLARQLLFSPPDRRIAQVRRAEQLHDQIDPDTNYPLDFINYRITGYRSEAQSTTVLPGQVILPDLRLMIDVLSRSVGVPADQDETVESPEEIARRLNVSTKTITRWRKAGLRWRWTLVPGTKRKQIVITRPGLDHFLDQHKEQVDRASQFKYLEPELRERLLKRARRIVEARDVSPHQVAQHLARRVGRATQTVRAALEQHDEAHPDDKLFLNRTEPLTERQKRVIARAHRMGVPTSKICKRFQRTRSTIFRVVRERRAAALRRLRIAFVNSPTFERDDADEVILRPVPVAALPRKAAPIPIDDLPEVLQPLYRQPAIGPKRMRSQFFRLNYLKFKAVTLRDKLDRYEPRVADLDQIEESLAQAATLRDWLVAGNLSVVLSVARRHLIDLPDQFTSNLHLIELLENSVPLLIEAVENFDPGRKQTFESYLTWHLMRQFATPTPGTPTPGTPTPGTSAAGISAAGISASGSGSPGRGRAHRREPPETVVIRMRAMAAALGVALPVGGEAESDQ